MIVARRRKPRWPIVLLILAVCLPARSQESENAESESIKYRHLYVPIKRIGELTRGYFPMQLDKFKDRIKGLESRTDGTEAAPRVERADYVASFDRTGVLVGEAKLQIVKTSEEPAMLQIKYLGLAIGRPRWDDEEPRDAEIGLTPRGTHVVNVEKSGQLAFPWSLRGASESADQWQFELSLPASPLNQITLTLEKDWIPLVDHGFAKQVVRDAAAAEVNTQDWLIELGGHHRVTLQVAKKTTLDQQTPIVLLRDNHAYRLVKNKINMSIDLGLSVYDAPLSQLVLSLDPELEIQSARLGNQPLLFRPMEPEADAKPSRHVLLEFPGPIVGPNRTIQLTAVVPLVRGRLLKLPRVRLEDVSWEEGRSTIQISKPLILQDFVAQDCRMSKLSQLPSPAQGESIGVQHFSPQSAVSVHVDLPAPHVQGYCGTTLQVSSQGLTASVVTDCLAKQGEQFLVEADLAAPWVVQSVDAVLLGAEDANEGILLDWDVLGRGGKRPKLAIQLRKAIRDDRLVRITVRAERPATANQLSINDMAVIRPSLFEVLRHVICIVGESPYEMELTGDQELASLDINDLPVQHRKIVQHQSAQHVFELNESTKNLRGQMRQVAARYVAECEVRAMVDDQGLTESYRIRCLPDTQIKRIYLQLSEKRDDTIRWSIDGGELNEVAARRLSQDEILAQRLDYVVGELWELQLSRSRNVPIVFTGHRTTPLSQRMKVSLVSLPNAARQSGALGIGVSNDAQIDLQNNGLQQIITPTTSPATFPTTRGFFRYQPGESSSLTIIAQDVPKELPSAWAWSSVLRSHFGHDQSVHTANFYLENTGRETTTIRIPSHAVFRAADVDGQRVLAKPINDGRAQHLTIKLPQNTRYPRLRVVYEDAQTLPQCVGNVAAPLFELDVPVFETRWSVWLPPGYDDLVEATGSQSETWRTRLFGPLAGNAIVEREPSVVWERLVVPQVSAKERDISAAVHLASELVRIARYLQTNQGLSRPTWQEVLNALVASAKDGEQEIKLFMDRRAMFELEIFANTPIFDLHPDSSPKNGLEILRKERLALMIAGDRVVLTSVRAMTMESHALTATSVPHVAVATDDYLKTNAYRFVETRKWVNQSQSPVSPWLADVAKDRDLNEWSCRQFEVTRSANFSVAVYPKRVVASFGWGVALLAVSLVWWTCLRRLQTVVWWIALAGVVALIVPAPYVPITSGLFLGVLLGAAMSVVRVPSSSLARPEPPRVVHSQSSTARAVVVGMLVAVLATVVVSSRIMGQEDEDVALTKPKIYPVVIPIDEDKSPTGVAYVPREFYDTILRHEKKVTGQSNVWILKSAMYQGELRREPATGQIKPVAFVANYEVETFKDSTLLRLPFQQKELFSSSLQVDGTVCELEWDDNLVIEIDSPGTHQVEFHFVPKLQTDPQISLTIPPAARSSVKVTFSGEMARIQFPSALGLAQKGGDDGTFVADLGPAEQLVIRWPTPNNTNEVVAEEAFWLKIGPGSVAIDANIRISAAEGRFVKEVHLVTDPRWQMRLLPDQPLDSPVITNQRDQQTVRIPVKQPLDARQLEFKARFVLSGASGVGRLQLPRLSAVAQRHGQRMFAMTIAPSLEHQLVSGQLAAIELQQFEQRWGELPIDQPQPQHTGELPNGLSSLIFTTKPRPRLTKIVEQLVVGVVPGQARLRYTANLDSGTEGRLRYRVHVPDGFRAEDVSVFVGDDEQPIRWSRTSTQHVAILGTSFFTGPHVLRIEGSVPIRQNGKVAIPRIRCEDVLVESSTTQIYHAAAVRLHLPNNSQVTIIDDAPMGTYKTEFGRLFVAIQNNLDDTNAIEPTMTVSANRPEFTDRQLTEVQRVDGEWVAKITSQIDVQSGTVDALRFSIPEFLEAPFATEVPGKIQVISPAGDDRRQLLFRPQQPISDQFQLVFHGAITGQPTRAPEVELLGAKSSQRFFLLPTRAESQPIQWLTPGLERTELPDDFGEAVENSQRNVCYEVQANLGPVQRFQLRAGKTDAFLSEVFIACQSGNRMYGVATFDVLPSGRDNCELVMPSDSELIHVSVAGLPAITQRASDNRWLVRLASTQLPHRISVVFRGRYLATNPSIANRCRFEAPQLSGVSVRKTLWTIQNPAGNVHRRQDDSSIEQTALDVDMQRYASFSDLVQASEESIRQHPQDQRDAWYRPWANRLSEIGEAASTRSVLSDEAQDGNQSLAEQVKSVQLDFASPPTSSQKQMFAEPHTVWDRSRSSQSSLTFVASKGASIEMTYDPSDKDDRRARTTNAVALVAACIAFVMLCRFGNLVVLYQQYPFAVGVIAGMAWWLFLAPSIVGLFLVGASVLGSLRSTSK